MRSRRAFARRRWAGSRRTASGYHALVSTKISPATAPWSPGTWAGPAGLLAVGQVAIVLAGDVVAWPTRPLAARETHDLERGVRVRVECLAFERLEAPAQPVRLRRPH